MGHKNKYHSTKFIEKKKKKRLLVISLYTLFGIVIFYALIFFSNHNFFKIKEIEIDNLRFIDKEEVEDISFEIIEDKKYLWLFPKSNSIIFPRMDIEQKLKENFNSIKKIDVDFAGLNKIKIKIIEYDPIAKWCDTTVIAESDLEHEKEMEDVNSVIPNTDSDTKNSKCYFLNENGIIFAPEPEIYLEKLISFFGLIENEDQNPIGEQFGTKERFNDLLNFTKLIRRLDISANEIWTKTGEVYAIVTNLNTKIYIDHKDDITEIFRNLESVIEQDAINKAQFENIEYIDLRFGNRVFYRLK